MARPFRPSVSGAEVLLAIGSSFELRLADEHAILEDGAGRHAGAGLHLAKEPKRFACRRGALAVLGCPREGFYLIHTVLAADCGLRHSECSATGKALLVDFGWERLCGVNKPIVELRSHAPADVTNRGCPDSVSARTPTVTPRLRTTGRQCPCGSTLL